MRSSSRPLYRRPRSPYWWARLTVNGREERKSTKCMTYKEAGDWLRAQLADVAEGRYTSTSIEKRVTRISRSMCCWISEAT